MDEVYWSRVTESKWFQRLQNNGLPFTKLCGGHALSENRVFSVYKGNKIRYYMKSNIHVVHVIITVICW